MDMNDIVGLSEEECLDFYYNRGVHQIKSRLVEQLKQIKKKIVADMHPPPHKARHEGQIAGLEAGICSCDKVASRDQPNKHVLESKE